MLRYVSPLAHSLRCTRSYQQNTVRRGVLLSLGTRVGFHTASNDHQAFRLTGSPSLARSSLAGFGFHFRSSFPFLKASPSSSRRLQAASPSTARGLTIRP